MRYTWDDTCVEKPDAGPEENAISSSHVGSALAPHQHDRAAPPPTSASSSASFSFPPYSQRQRAEIRPAWRSMKVAGDVGRGGGPERDPTFPWPDLPSVAQGTP